MHVKILKESGYEQAILGLSLSYGVTFDNAAEVARKLSHKQGGHNKFLESMMIWLDVKMPRYFWVEADTYRLSTKQSEATMHTILKRELNHADFCRTLPFGWLEVLNDCIKARDVIELKKILPESFLQRRIWCMSYKTLQNIIFQRHNHKLSEWHYFCKEVLENAGSPEFLQVRECNK